VTKDEAEVARAQNRRGSMSRPDCKAARIGGKA
jgi:hypothetical protein